jgi:RNA polymerase sigma-70 factor, ECF subfamily
MLQSSAVDEKRTFLSDDCEEALRRRPLPGALHAGFHAFVSAKPEASAAFVDDLLLAYGAACGDRSCLEVLERDFFQRLRPLLGRLRLSADDLDELAQHLRVELLVGRSAGDGEQTKKILRYGGTGPLGAFLRAVATRAALSDLRRTPRASTPGDSDFDCEIMGFATSEDDPLKALHGQHGQALGQALRQAVKDLAPRERNLLRMYVLDGANIETIGSVYGVHRATIARWISEIRIRLAREARARMTPLVSASEAVSIARLCFSQLDLSLDRLLADGLSSRAG